MQRACFPNPIRKKQKERKKKARERRSKKKILERRSDIREDRRLKKEVERLQWENRERITPIKKNKDEQEKH